MALNTTLRSPTGAITPSHSEAVGDSGTATVAPATSLAATNPIGTGVAKLLNGDTQDQDNALQLLKYDAYDVSLAQDKLSALQSAGGSAEDIASAQSDVATKRNTYASDLKNSTEGYALTSSRINRYLTGGAHPVPDNALIPSSDEDVTAFLQTMTDGDTQSTSASTTTTEQPVTGTNTSSTANAVKDTGPGTVSYVDNKLSAAMQAHLATSSDVLASSSITDPSASGKAVTSGDLSKSFTLFPNGTPSPNDVNQNLSSDCYYMSALSSLAASSAGQKTIQNAISGPAKNGDYTVTLHNPEGELVDVAVNPNNLPVTANGDPATNSSAGNVGGANWVNLMEAAYAKYNDAYGTNTETAGSGATGYDGTSRDGITDTTFNTALTGLPSTSYEITGKDPKTVAAQLKAGLQAGTPVEAYNLDTASSTTDSGVTLVPAHAYAVSAISDDGQNVTVRNPWGQFFPEQTPGENADGTFTMSIADFTKNFEQINA